MTTIELTPEDAVLFVQFQKRFTFMKLLESVGAFDLKPGTLTVSFDNFGQIRSVDVQRHFKLPG